jgi:hypothetical protein
VTRRNESADDFEAQRMRQVDRIRPGNSTAKDEFPGRTPLSRSRQRFHHSRNPAFMAALRRTPATCCDPDMGCLTVMSRYNIP